MVDSHGFGKRLIGKIVLSLVTEAFAQRCVRFTILRILLDGFLVVLHCPIEFAILVKLGSKL